MKSLKSIASASLLIFVAVSIVYLAFAKDMSSNSIASALGQNASACREGELCSGNVPKKQINNSTIVAYYFHRTVRCRTCRAMESNAREAIEKSMSAELGKGLLSVQSLNVEEPANRHFIEQYQITGPSLVLSYMQDGKEVRWKNLDRTWELIHTPTDYQAYVVSEVKSFMSSGS